MSFSPAAGRTPPSWGAVRLFAGGVFSTHRGGVGASRGCQGGSRQKVLEKRSSEKRHAGTQGMWKDSCLNLFVSGQARFGDSQYEVGETVRENHGMTRAPELENCTVCPVNAAPFASPYPGRRAYRKLQVLLP